MTVYTRKIERLGHLALVEIYEANKDVPYNLPYQPGPVVRGTRHPQGGFESELGSVARAVPLYIALYITCDYQENLTG